MARKSLIAREIKRKKMNEKYSQLRKELKEKGLKQAEKFSWEKTAKQTLKVYEEVLKQ